MQMGSFYQIFTNLGIKIFGVFLVLPFLSFSQNIRLIDSLKHLLINCKTQCYEITYDLGYEYIDIDNKLALQYLNKAYGLAQGMGDSLKITKTLRQKAFTFRKLELIDSAIIYYNRILPIARRNFFTQELIFILNGLGNCYTERADYHKALSCHLESYHLRKETNDMKAAAISLNNVGLIYYKLNNIEKALEYFLKCLDLKKELGDEYYKK